MKTLSVINWSEENRGSNNRNELKSCQVTGVELNYAFVYLEY